MSLASNRADHIAAISKGVLGMVPGAGSILGEIVGYIIPNQRVDRIADFAQRLSSKVADIEQEVLRSRMTKPDIVDLIEQSFIQASRASTDTRREHIATLLKNSLTEDQVDALQKQSLMRLLGELNDVELILLQSYAYRYYGDPEQEDFYKKHDTVMRLRSPHMGSTQAEIEEYALFESYRVRLATLGLLDPRFNRPRHDELPEFDESTGMMKSSGYELSSLGRLLLRSLDLKTDF